MVRVYGIKNCDTVKKAMKWLAEQGIEAQLYDYRVDGLDPEWLAQAAQQFGWENLINKRSTTWRNLDESQKTLEKKTAISLLLDYPTLIKRPIILQDGVALLGFNSAEYAQAFQSSKG